jgi:hypothetical protein
MIRDCEHCACASRVWNSGPEELICVNSPGHAGQMTRIPASGNVAESCRGFRAKPEALIQAEMPTPADESVRYIPLIDGRFAIVDAADFEWLSRYTWRGSGGGMGYASSRIKNKRVFMHRLIMNPPPGKVVDHVNGNQWDNRRANLRVCTQAENTRNRRKSRGTSRFKGVSWNARRRKWVAAIRLNRKAIYLGLFDDEIEAARAYDLKARELFGPYAYLNFPSATQIVLLSGRIDVHSHIQGTIRISKSEIRMSKSETNPNHRNPKFKTAPRSASAFGSLDRLSFGNCLEFRPPPVRGLSFPRRRESRFEIPGPFSCFPMVMATGPPKCALRVS